jgi:hypothetical protein
MFPTIEFNESAFRHGISETRIRYAMKRPIYEELVELYINKWLIIGYDMAGNLLEVAYNIIDDDAVNVFHAMPCRKKFLDQLDYIGR